MTDFLDIPEFLRRSDPAQPTGKQRRPRRRKLFNYPRDGYLGKGLRAQARDRLRASRRRHAEQCRLREPRSQC